MFTRPLNTSKHQIRTILQKPDKEMETPGGNPSFGPNVGQSVSTPSYVDNHIDWGECFLIQYIDSRPHLDRNQAARPKCLTGIGSWCQEKDDNVNHPDLVLEPSQDKSDPAKGTAARAA